MSSKKVLTGPERKLQILETGAKLAAEHGKENVTRRMVAKACGCAESLISEYVGDSATAQNAYARKAKALGLVLPDKKTSAELGKKLRAHGPRDKRDTRKRSAKEVEAIKRKAGGNGRKPTSYRSGVVAQVPAAKKSAAKKAATRVSSQPGLPKGVSVTSRTTKDGATVVNVKGRRAGVDLRQVVAAVAASLPADQRQVKPKHLPARPLPTPADAPRVVTPALPTPQPPERKTAARKPKAPPIAPSS